MRPSPKPWPWKGNYEMRSWRARVAASDWKTAVPIIWRLMVSIISRVLQLSIGTRSLGTVTRHHWQIARRRGWALSRPSRPRQRPGQVSLPRHYRILLVVTGQIMEILVARIQLDDLLKTCFWSVIAYHPQG